MADTKLDRAGEDSCAGEQCLCPHPCHTPQEVCWMEMDPHLCTSLCICSLHVWSQLSFW